MSIKTKTLKIYTDGHLDYIATYRPLIRDNLVLAFNYLDFMIANSRRPRDGEL